MKLIDNGLDSFKNALLKMFNIENEDINEIEYVIKDIILSFHHSLETLFKYLVQECNEYLIYENQREIFEYEACNSNKKITKKTIQFMDAINRVIVLYKLNLSKDIYCKIECLNKIRNSLTHHQCDLETKEIENLIATILPSILDIFSKHIPGFSEYMGKYNISSNIESLYTKVHSWEITTLLNTLGEIENAEKRLSDINKDNNIRKKIISQMNPNYTYSKCEICGGNFFISNGTVIKDCNSIAEYGECSLCGFKLKKDILALQHTSYKTYPNLKQFIEEGIRELLANYEYRYGLTEIKEIKECILENVKAFNKLFHNFIRDIITDILKFIIEKQIEDIVSDENDKGINFIIEIFNNISPEDRIYILNRIYNLWSLIEIYEINTDEKVESMNIKYIINDISVSCSYDEILDLYNNWLKRKNSEDEMLEYFMQHKDYEKILDDILYDTENSQVWSQLAGSSLCDFGTVDKVDAECGEVEYIEGFIQTEDDINIVSVFQVSISTELYSCGEFIHNGSTTIYIEVNINIDRTYDSMEIEDLRLLG